MEIRNKFADDPDLDARSYEWLKRNGAAMTARTWQWFAREENRVLAPANFYRAMEPVDMRLPQWEVKKAS